MRFNRGITSATDTNTTNACDKSHRSKYFIPFTGEDQMESFKDQGFSISHNPSDNSNCQFPTLLHLPEKIGIHRSGRSVRQEVVSYLSENPENSGGQLLKHFTRIEYDTNRNIR